MRCVIDANVLVAELRREEPHHERARAFLHYIRELALTVDLVPRRGLKPRIRASVLSSSEELYAR